MKSYTFLTLILAGLFTVFIARDIYLPSLPASDAAATKPAQHLSDVAELIHKDSEIRTVKPAALQNQQNFFAAYIEAANQPKTSQAMASNSENDPGTAESTSAYRSGITDKLTQKTSSLSPLLAQAQDLGVANINLPLNITVGLQLRNKAGLDAFLTDVSNPDSPNYQQFLTQAEFNSSYAPTKAQQQKVVNWLTDSGFKITNTFDNHLLISAEGTHEAAIKAFAVSIHNVAQDNQIKYAAVTEPSFPTDIAGLVSGVAGLDNLAAMKPKAVATALATSAPSVGLSDTCCHFGPKDIKTLYNDGSILYDNFHQPLDGRGQTVVIAGAYSWNNSDVNGFNRIWGLNLFNRSNSQQICTGAEGSVGCQFNLPNSIEVSLDAEYLHAIIPGATIKNYMAADSELNSFSIMYNRIVLDNPGHVVTTSWGSCEAETPLAVQLQNDVIIANGIAVGQSWFAASGDNGAYGCNTDSKSVDHPANLPYIIGVGGTTPTCSSGMSGGSGSCGGYGSETAWKGSGGGVSAIFRKPRFQTGCGIDRKNTKRLVPDVSLAADPDHYGYYVTFNGRWYLVGGTSAAAPQWAGYFVQLNQYKPGNGKGFGLPGVRIYELCDSNAIHDITDGDNGAYSSGPLYDNVTGVGSIDVDDFFTNY